MSNNFDVLAERLKREVAAGSTGQAKATLYEGLSLDQTRFCSALKLKGALRCSAYDFDAHKLTSLVNDVLAAQPLLVVLAPDTRVYFSSISALLSIGASCRAIYQEFVRDLDVKYLKSYIAAVDHLFWFPPRELHESSLSTSYNGFSIESHASALSTYIFELSKRNQLNAVNVNLLDERKAVSGYFLTNLEQLAALGRYREAEVLIDCLNYTAVVKGRKVIISASNPDFEKAIRLGYIQFETQMFSDAANLTLQVKSWRFDELCKGFYEHCGDLMVMMRDDPVERIVIGLPDDPLMRDLIEGDTYFAEEIVQVTFLQKELLLRPDQVTGTHIAEGLTILDVLKFQRLFRLMQFLFTHHVRIHGLERSPLLYRSMVPVYRVAAMQSFLEKFYGVDKAKSFLAAFTWDPAGDSIFDIQTQPLLRCGNHYIVPIGILAGSNLVRNHLMRTRFRFDAESTEDPVGDALEAVLANAGTIVKRNVTYRYGGSDGEVDAIAVLGEDVFAFECKNSLHPCSPFEIRTSYDYIRKGAKQMCLFAGAFGDMEFRANLASRLGLTLSGNARLHTSIVTGNRMFSGWREAGVPVRPLYEMCNFIKTGETKLKASRGQETDVRVLTLEHWKGTCFTPQDLTEYIENDSLHRPRFNAMKPWDKSTDIGRKRLVLSSFLMDPAEETRQLTRIFRGRLSLERNPFVRGAETTSAEDSGHVEGDDEGD